MRRVVRVLALVAAALLVAAAAVAGVAYWQARSIVGQLQAGAKRVEVAGAQGELHREPRVHFVAPKVEQAHGAQTILLIGSDHRYGTGGSNARSDTIILARIDASRHRIALLSIPRDLYVPIAGLGNGRINEAFTLGGAGLLIRTVREVFGVEIDHFVEIDFAGFRQLVDDVGGVYLPIEQRYFNVNLGTPGTNYSNIDLQPGYQRLSGAQALAFARFRHTDSDFYRAARQQIFLRTVLGKVLTFTPDLFALRSRAEAFAKATTSDISSLSELWWLFRAVQGTGEHALVRETLQAQDLTLGGADYLSATAAERRAAVRALFARPASAASGSSSATTQAQAAKHAPSLVPDGGRGAELLRPTVPIRRCAPTKLPAGYAWPATGAVRSYALAGHPAIAAWASAASGRSVLFMWTTWRSPPALAHPTTTLDRGGRTYSVWTENGHIRQIAWQHGPTRAWITNTLRDELGNAQMIGLAEACRPLSAR